MRSAGAPVFAAHVASEWQWAEPTRAAISAAMAHERSELPTEGCVLLWRVVPSKVSTFR